MGKPLLTSAITTSFRRSVSTSIHATCVLHEQMVYHFSFIVLLKTFICSFFCICCFTFLSSSLNFIQPMLLFFSILGYYFILLIPVLSSYPAQCTSTPVEALMMAKRSFSSVRTSCNRMLGLWWFFWTIILSLYK